MCFLEFLKLLPSTIASVNKYIRDTLNVFTFGGAKRSGSDRECKYFPIGMNAREPLWR